MAQKGKLFVIEGMDGTGKTSCVEWLMEHSKIKDQLKSFREPTRDGTLSNTIKSALKGDVIMDNEMLAKLFAADRFEQLYKPEGVIDTLNKGMHIIQDRNYLSSMVLQSTGDVENQLDITYNINKNYIDSIDVDYWFILIDDPASAFDRVDHRGGDKDFTESLEMLEKQCESYRAHAERIAKESNNVLSIYVGDKSVEEIAKVIESTMLRVTTPNASFTDYSIKRIGLNVEGVDILKSIEEIARVCYKSHDKMTDDSYEQMIKSLRDREHLAMFEFSMIVYKIRCDRAVSHELVRHRHSSFAQESQRYVNYVKHKMEFNIPSHFSYADRECIQSYSFYDTALRAVNEELHPEKVLLENNPYLTEQAAVWYVHNLRSQIAYEKLLDCKLAPQHARGVLPNACKTEIVMGGNIRQWMNVLSLRTESGVHPDTKQICEDILKDISNYIPIAFDKISERVFG